MGLIKVDDSNRPSLESSYGFNFHIPKTLKGDKWIGGTPFVGITIYDIKLKDLEDLREEFFAAIVDDHALSELRAFKMTRFIRTFYTGIYSEKDNNQSELNFSMSIYKQNNSSSGPNTEIVREFSIGDIPCKIIEVTRAIYPKEMEGKWYDDDITQKPEEITKYRYLTWQYDGLSFSVIDIGIREKAAIEFAEDYIESLKGISK